MGTSKSNRSGSSSDDPDSGSYDSSGTLIPALDGPSTSEARKEKGRVRFNSNAAVTQPPVLLNIPSTVQEHRGASIPRPPPSVLRGNLTPSTTNLQPGGEPEELDRAAVAAKERAEQIAAKVRRDSPTPSSRASLDSIADTATFEGPPGDYGIALQDLSYPKTRDGWTRLRGDEENQTHNQELQKEAFKLVRAHTHQLGPSAQQESWETRHHQHQSRQDGGIEELNDGNLDGVYAVPPPEQYRGSVLSQLLKLYNKPQEPGMHGSGHKRNSSYGAGTYTPGSGSATTTPGTMTPTRKKWYEQNKSQDTLANLIGASAKLANPNIPIDSQAVPTGALPGKKRPMHKRTGSSSRLSQFWQNQETRITIHIAETLSRQDYIIKLCRALMLFGAPTHRLEEYLSMTARVLEIDGQFLYLPGCMLISFDDKSTHTTEVRIVRTVQGIDLGKLKDVHHIYKEVMHDVIGVEEGTTKLDALMTAKDKFNPWLRVLIFGLTSATAGPFSFSARLIDLPLSFCFGCLVGVLQLIVAPKSQLYSNVFEVSATVVVSFLARAFGSLKGGNLFCFSAMAQSGIVMLLPGYAVCK